MLVPPTHSIVTDIHPDLWVPIWSIHIGKRWTARQLACPSRTPPCIHHNQNPTTAYSYTATRVQNLSDPHTSTELLALIFLCYEPDSFLNLTMKLLDCLPMPHPREASKIHPNHKRSAPSDTLLILHLLHAYPFILQTTHSDWVSKPTSCDKTQYL